MARGFFMVGVYHPKTEVNIGTLVRSAFAFHSAGVFTIGKRYKKQASDVKLHRHIPITEFKTMEDFRAHIPLDARMVAVEIVDDAVDLRDFKHPERAVYLLGAEDHGIPKELMSGMMKVKIPSAICLNVATAGSIIMYDRISKER